MITAEGVGGPDYIFLSRPRIQKVRSDKRLHFTGALAKNASEEENLTGLIHNKIIITGVTITSRQSLRYQLLFFSKDGFTDSDLDKDTFIGSVEIDMSNYGRPTT